MFSGHWRVFVEGMGQWWLAMGVMGEWRCSGDPTATPLSSLAPRLVTSPQHPLLRVVWWGGTFQLPRRFISGHVLCVFSTAITSDNCIVKGLPYSCVLGGSSGPYALLLKLAFNTVKANRLIAVREMGNTDRGSVIGVRTLMLCSTSSLNPITSLDASKNRPVDKYRLVNHIIICVL